jgi:hypothetical protein
MIYEAAEGQVIIRNVCPGCQAIPDQAHGMIIGQIDGIEAPDGVDSDQGIEIALEHLFAEDIFDAEVP